MGNQVLLYFDEKSGDAALYIARPDQWDSLNSYFSDWLEGLDQDEREELLPEWLDNYLTIGEIPHSGNFILVPTAGEKPVMCLSSSTMVMNLLSLR